MKKFLATILLLTGSFSMPQAATLADIQIADRSTGQTLEIWRHRGRLYVAGAPGNRYAVRIHNRSGTRIMTVLSVDGVNAVSGQTASPAQTGYVLSVGQTTEIAGWRKSMDEVAAFYFTNLSDSYAARTDRPQNVGVIGVAVFPEYQPPQYVAPAPREPSADTARPAGSAPRSETIEKSATTLRSTPAPALGTGHGERVDSRVNTTEFRRANSRPAEVITIYYDSHANLVARGIIQPPDAGHDRPNPFPAGFVPDPKR